MRFNKFLFGVLLSVILLFSALIGKAQGQRVSGMITGNNERLSGAIVKNLNTHDEAISNERGTFSMNVAAGDTLLISKDFYRTDTSVFHGQDYLIIQLKQPIRVLQEVMVKDTLSDPLKIYNQNKKDYKDIFWKGMTSTYSPSHYILGRWRVLL